MPGPKPPALCLSENDRQQLEALVRRHTTPQPPARRARIVLLAHHGHSNQAIADPLGVGCDMVRLWRGRWPGAQGIPAAGSFGIPRDERGVAACLADAPRPGAPAKISPNAYCRIMALACQPPQDHGRPITHWTDRELAQEAIAQAIVPTVSPRSVGRFLKRSGPEAPPHLLLADARRGPRPRPQDRRRLPAL